MNTIEPPRMLMNEATSRSTKLVTEPLGLAVCLAWLTVLA